MFLTQCADVRALQIVDHLSSYHSRLHACLYNDAAASDVYTLSLHDALPICILVTQDYEIPLVDSVDAGEVPSLKSIKRTDRKSTRLNSSHQIISYAVFCLKKKTQHPAP